MTILQQPYSCHMKYFFGCFEVKGPALDSPPLPASYTHALTLQEHKVRHMLRSVNPKKKERKKAAAAKCSKHFLTHRHSNDYPSWECSGNSNLDRELLAAFNCATIECTLTHCSAEDRKTLQRIISGFIDSFFPETVSTQDVNKHWPTMSHTVIL